MKQFITTFLIFVAVSWPQIAHAYIGPAVAFVSYLFGPVVAVIAVVGLILYLPIKALLKKRKQKDNDQEDSQPEKSDDEPNKSE
jgi:hypothetical protein